MEIPRLKHQHMRNTGRELSLTAGSSGSRKPSWRGGSNRVRSSASRDLRSAGGLRECGLLPSPSVGVSSPPSSFPLFFEPHKETMMGLEIHGKLECLYSEYDWKAGTTRGREVDWRWQSLYRGREAPSSSLVWWPQ